MKTPKPYPAQYPSRYPLKALSALLMSALMAGCAAPVTRTVWVYEQPASASATEPATIARVGTVDRIELVETQVGVTGAGAATGAVLGGVLTSPMGRGGPRGPGFFPLAVVGIVAGALIGNHVEQQQAQAASSRHYLVSINFDDKTRQTYEVMVLNGLHTGERVQIERGEIKPVPR